MKISLIITTYNWPAALELSLKSALRQSRLPAEIIVADDGSTSDTGEMVCGLARKSSVSLIHSWQEDRGFRAARSRNLAMARATGDYFVFIDGDMVLERHFIEDHGHWATAGVFVQGGRALLDAGLTRTALANGQTAFSPFVKGMANRKNCIRAAGLARFFSGNTSRLAGIRTCNFAFWKEDAVRVNGFNEEFEGWGREDSDFAARLLHSGVRRLNLRFSAVAWHLHHPENSRQSLEKNDQLLAETIRLKKTWCEQGLDRMQNVE
ncbi:MAG: family 2 glycosyl transferase [Deltaproteobacteria bacterium RIFOXYD12_FULL_57_12]|nr:MAG: family 2 glycosyl transferase [Deltaproteobacteria bacterium RIFOXYD12_FULL_57_12]